MEKKCKKASQINPRRSILTIRMNHVMHMCGYVIRGSNFKTGIKVRKAKHTDLGRGINTGCLTFARIFLSKVLSKSCDCYGPCQKGENEWQPYCNVPNTIVQTILHENSMTRGEPQSYIDAKTTHQPISHVAVHGYMPAIVNKRSLANKSSQHTF